MKIHFTLFAAILLLPGILAAAQKTVGIQTYEANFETFRPTLNRIQKDGIEFADYHVHLMNGGTMTAQSVADYQKAIGIPLGVLENAGREWILSDNQKISAWLDELEAAAFRDDPNHKAFLIGIQVNDRDWFRTISPENLARLDYVLADTLVMTKPDGTPQPLWELPKDWDVDPEVWMKGYFAHCLRVLDEPVTIWADPTYLPDFCADRYDQLWTDERLNALIEKAVRNGIAIEVQSPSRFANQRFFRMALAKGAKLVFGTNNFDDQPKTMSGWVSFFENVPIRNEQILHLKAKSGNRTEKANED